MVKWGNFNIEDFVKFEKKIAILILMIAFIIVLGIATFIVLENLPLDKAAYYTLTSAIGYGFTFKNDLTLVISSFIMIMEWACLWIGFETVVGFISEGRMREVIGGVRMRKRIDKMKEHCILCGFGRVGSEIAKTLHSQKRELVIVEKDPHIAREAMNKGYMVLQGDVLSEETLKAAGMDRARMLIAAMGSDADNVFLTLTARGINPKIKVIARAEREESIKKLKQAGATEVVMPSVIGGKAMANAVLYGAK